VPHLAKPLCRPEAVQKLNIVSNEDNFRQMQEDSGALAAAIASSPAPCPAARAITKL